MKPCTLWYRPTHRGKANEFNHLADGHETGDTPAPKCPAHVAAWAGAGWVAVHAWLSDELPAKVVHTPAEETVSKVIPQEYTGG